MKRDIDLGVLGTGEASGVVGVTDPVANARARKHYEEVLAIAKAARKEFMDRLSAGVPTIGDELPGGGRDGMKVLRATVACAEVSRLANALAWVNVRLFLAAQQVCDLENLDDDGENEGIEWKVLL